MANNPYLQLIPRPAPGSINSGLSALRISTQLELLGRPRATFGRDCQPVTNAALKRRIITASVGPFKVTGFDLCVYSLQHIMADVQAFDPVLYANLGSAGMLCARLVRGSNTAISNHSFGVPLDLTVFKVLDVRGDGKCLSALMDLYAIFHAHGWYWGASYPTEDAMHWEPAEQTFRRWMQHPASAPQPYKAPPPIIAPAVRPSLVVNGLVIPGAYTEDRRLIVPARPACTALDIECLYAEPGALQFGTPEKPDFLHGRKIDGRLYVPARDLCQRAGRALQWDAANQTGTVKS